MNQRLNRKPAERRYSLKHVTRSFLPVYLKESDLIKSIIFMYINYFKLLFKALRYP
jgi:hypothetical protein